MTRTKTVGYTIATGHMRGRAVLGVTATVLAVALLGGAFVLGRVTAPTAAAADNSGAVMPMRNGVPVSKRQSTAGAATAAMNFQIAGFRVAAGTLDASAAETVLLDSRASTNARHVLAAPTTSSDDLAKTRTTFAPVSVMVERYSPEVTVVQVWGVAASSSQLTPQPGGSEDWGRATIEVTWDGRQWRVTDQHYTQGPWPVRSTERLTSAIGDFSFRFHDLAQDGWSYVAES